MARRYQIKPGQSLLQVAEEGGYNLPSLLTANPGVYQVTTGQGINLPSYTPPTARNPNLPVALGGTPFVSGNLPVAGNAYTVTPGGKRPPMSISPGLGPAAAEKLKAQWAAYNANNPTPHANIPLPGQEERQKIAAPSQVPYYDPTTGQVSRYTPTPMGIESGFVTVNTPNGPVDYQRAFTQKDIWQMAAQSGMSRAQAMEQLQASGYVMYAGQMVYSGANPAGSPAGGGWSGRKDVGRQFFTTEQAYQTWVSRQRRGGGGGPKVRGESTRSVSGPLRTSTG